MQFDTKRYICGLCVKNCRQNALELKIAPDAKKPVNDNNALMMGMLPQYVSTSFKIWLRRSLGI